ncbi:hypothetical protein Shyhy02_06230 [Streptomyces hygroscopicus subsp. hygroscopicus]|nr:hypothetical protein Shyhy02_06230 [Streptomyces hygroscopicus subsp. hygroscopicus]
MGATSNATAPPPATRGSAPRAPPPASHRHDADAHRLRPADRRAGASSAGPAPAALPPRGPMAPRPRGPAASWPRHPRGPAAPLPDKAPVPCGLRERGAGRRREPGAFRAEPFHEADDRAGGGAGAP